MRKRYRNTEMHIIREVSAIGSVFFYNMLKRELEDKLNQELNYRLLLIAERNYKKRKGRD